jgi:Ca-activated chloride channel family protein
VKALFDAPMLLAAAGIVPLAVAFALWLASRRRRRRLANLGEESLVARLLPATAPRAPHWHAARLLGATACAAIAFGGPRWGSERTVQRSEGADVVIAMDVSKSMLATDERPNRLERAKQEVRRLRAAGRADRFALIAFAGRSYVLTPLTTDEGALDLYLENLDPSIVGQPGSAIAPALRQGTELLLASKSSADRALVLLTDGESFEEPGDLEAAARYARENEVHVVAVGFGTTQGATIPEIEDGARSVHKDRDGNVVITRHHPETLDLIARASAGTMVQASGDRASRVRTALGDLRTQARTVDSGALRKARFQLFLWPAFLLLLLDVFRVGRSRRAVRRVVAAAGIAVAMVGMARPSAAQRPGVVPPDSDTTAVARAAARERMRAATVVREWRTAIAGGDHRPATMYNLGTALLAADSMAGAIEVLEVVQRTPDNTLRHRVLFNLGLAHLKRGLAGRAQGEQALASAAEVYKRLLLARPHDIDAKWNYELALRQHDGGGGSGGAAAPAPAGPRPEPERPQPHAGRGISRQQAQQLLDNAARDERDVQGKRQQRARGEPPRVEKDWQ